MRQGTARLEGEARLIYTVYFAPTANGYKILILLEALGLPYRLRYVDLAQGEQHQAEMSSVTPHGKIPVLVDHEHDLALPESAAILQYLAETHGRFLPPSGHERYRVLHWLAWQVSSLGPMAGQLFHFNGLAAAEQGYAQARYGEQTHRLFATLDRALATDEYVGGQYSIADMAIYPWVRIHARLGMGIDEFVHIQRYLVDMGNGRRSKLPMRFRARRAVCDACCERFCLTKRMRSSCGGTGVLGARNGFRSRHVMPRPPVAAEHQCVARWLGPCPPDRPHHGRKWRFSQPDE